MKFSLNQILVTAILMIWFIKETRSKTFHGFTKPCSDSSPECLQDFVKSALKDYLEGVPELGIPCFDPFVFNKVEFNLPSGLKIEFLDGVSTGFKKCIIDFVRQNGTSYEIMSHCNLTIEGKYISSGRMLMFPVNGDGDATIKCRNIKIYMSFELIPKMAADRREHLEIKNFTSNHDFEGNVHYNFTNIFKGNPLLSKTVLDFMNKSWRLVAEEFGNPVVNYGITTIYNSVKKLFLLVPAEELVVR